MSNIPLKITTSGRENTNYNTTTNDDDHSITDSLPANEPPKLPRSAFICYSDAIQKDMNLTSSSSISHKEGLRIVAAKWAALTNHERAEWEEVSRQDKVRYAREKAEYTGTWVVPKRRARKHPDAPKRPMSAFLKYSQSRRKDFKEANPDMNNTDISRLLGESWRTAPEDEKKPYIESEMKERAMYNEAIGKFRERQAQIDAASRTSHHSVQRRPFGNSVDEQIPKRQRRSSDTDATSESNRMVTTKQRAVDQRIFRPHSGSIPPPADSRHYGSDQRKLHGSYHRSDTMRSHSSNNVEPIAYQFRKTDHVRPQNSDPNDGGYGMNVIHPVSYHAHNRLHSYHPSYPPPTQQTENRYMMPIANTGSDLFDNNTFYEPDAPYNNRQSRSSSRYFQENF